MSIDSSERSLVGLLAVIAAVAVPAASDCKWAGEHLEDVRVIDTDHFIIFRHPEIVAQLVLEALGPTT